ncbi:MAG: hypothetical protein ACKO3N_22160 [Verrucomicrobiota bacterium]
MNPVVKSWPALVVGVVLSAWLAGCGNSEPAGGGGEAGHGHQPKNGGYLVEVGRHEFNLEVLRDPAAGRLTVWLLDAHAENYVRSGAAQLDLEITAGGTTRNLPLAAVASAATGEKVGDTSQFEGVAEWLRGTSPLTVRLPRLSLRGKTFDGLSFAVPPREGTSHP